MLGRRCPGQLPPRQEKQEGSAGSCTFLLLYILCTIYNKYDDGITEFHAKAMRCIKGLDDAADGRDDDDIYDDNDG